MEQQLYVARGRTVIIGSVSYGPGESAPIAPDDVERLTKLGFVQDTAPVLTASHELNPAGVGMQGARIQGAAYNAR